MDNQPEKTQKFIEKIKWFHPRQVKFPDSEEILLYYYYNLDYNCRKEEEHKLEAWNKWINNVYKYEKKLFLSVDDLTISLAYKVQDEEKVQTIIDNLIKKKMLVSSSKILEGIGNNIQK